MKLLPLILMVFLAGLTGLQGEETQSPPAATPKVPKLISEYGLPGMDTRISLDVIQPMDVVELIKFLALKGDLKDFPFQGGKAGLFQVVVKVTDGTLNYHDRWPRLENIAADMSPVDCHNSSAAA